MEKQQQKRLNLRKSISLILDESSASVGLLAPTTERDGDRRSVRASAFVRQQHKSNYSLNTYGSRGKMIII